MSARHPKLTVGFSRTRAKVACHPKRGVVDKRERRVVRPEGLEPPAYRFEACRSIQLSYGRILQLVGRALARRGDSYVVSAFRRTVTSPRVYPDRSLRGKQTTVLKSRFAFAAIAGAVAFIPTRAGSSIGRAADS